MDAFSSYRLDCSENDGMSYEVLLKYMEVYSLLMYPIAPHFSDYVWTTYLKNEKCIGKGDWPKDLVFDPILARENDFLKKNVKACRDLVTKKIKGVELGSPKTAYLYVLPIGRDVLVLLLRSTSLGSRSP